MVHIYSVGSYLCISISTYGTHHIYSVGYYLCISISTHGTHIICWFLPLYLYFYIWYTYNLLVLTSVSLFRTWYTYNLLVLTSVSLFLHMVHIYSVGSYLCISISTYGTHILCWFLPLYLYFYTWYTYNLLVLTSVSLFLHMVHI